MPKTHRVAAPCTANVWRIDYSEGESVTADSEIMTLESMKLEIPIKAEISGTLKKLWVQEGEIVNQDEVLFEIEMED